KRPFNSVYLTGMVRDSQRRKMSKQLGNSPDPLDLMAKYGADGMRVGMLLCSPAGNDLLFDESLPEQGRNFCNKIWNAFRLVQGWTVGDSIAQPLVAKASIEWFENVLNKAIAQLNADFDKYRISDALMNVYKLFWDEFSSWLLEMVKPAFQQPIDGTTYRAVLSLFERLMVLLHPFMPFITEELWQHIYERKSGQSIMNCSLPKAGKYDKKLLEQFETAKEIITNVRSVRQEKSIPNKNTVSLFVKGSIKLSEELESVISKLAGLDKVEYVTEKIDGAISFMVQTTEFFVPLAGLINVDEEIEKLNNELNYYQGFLASVLKKLGNEKFVNGAPEQVVAAERRKQADAEAKIKALLERISGLAKG
ncbi:MAG TPA: class I tRNA ligase family protein, partial [Tenuifilaceae bacterium]|nr:class I tRNA ligase family protein [Tenuifilaceae bacterium]